jgi:photosystem II stability/assembly factor-like uncharacterized protein
MNTRPAGAGLPSIFLLLIVATAAFATDIDYAMQLPGAQHSLLLDVERAGRNLVAVGERGHILVSTDQGASWKQVQVPTSVMLTRVFFADDQHGWVVGHDGNVLYSRDGGLTWSLQRDGLADQVRINEARAGRARERVAELEEALAAATDAQSELLARSLEDAQWRLDNALEAMERPVYAPPLMDVWFATPEQGWASGAYGTLLYTANGGRNWEDWSHKVDNPEELHLNGVVGDTRGGVFLASEWGTVFRSGNGGETWQALETGYDGSFFGVVISPDSGDIFAYGLRGTIYRADADELEWQALDSGVSASLFGVTADGATLVFVGRGGTATLTNDNGESFQPVVQRRRDGLFGAVALGDGRYMATGEGGSRLLELAEAEGGQP